jgi:PPOX class probable F420-dependent enzyme
MPSALPAELQHQKYLSLGTFRKNGLAVQTPVWFAEQDGKIYAMTRNDSGKFKRIRNNPTVRVAPSTIRGKIIGPEFPGQARVLPAEDWPRARKLLAAKYWLMRMPFLWSSKNVFLEITL